MVSAQGIWMVAGHGCLRVSFVLLASCWDRRKYLFMLDAFKPVLCRSLLARNNKAGLCAVWAPGCFVSRAPFEAPAVLCKHVHGFHLHVCGLEMQCCSRGVAFWVWSVCVHTLLWCTPVSSPSEPSMIPFFCTYSAEGLECLTHECLGLLAVAGGWFRALIGHLLVSA